MSEATEQAALFQWAEIAQAQIPSLAFLAHWPNGGKRDKAAAGQLKAQGVKKGPADVWLFVRNPLYVGFVFEFKTRKGNASALQRLTPEQSMWFAHLERQGWLTGAYYDWPDAARAICRYLGTDYSVWGL